MAKSSVTATSHDVFPTIYACSKLANGQRLYDVKFCPFQIEDEDPVFAVAGEKDIFLCRLSAIDGQYNYDTLRWWQDVKVSTSSYNSIAWTGDPLTGRPWICIAGSTPKQIQILDVETGEHVRTLIGHGRGINDLAVSPLSRNLLVSAGEDYRIHLWNLHPECEKQPCVAVFAGEGHRQPVLAAQFHRSGRWMLSGGLDTAVCLWAVPSLEEIERSDGIGDHPDPHVVYYPHFYSTEVHANYVDTLIFYGDLIISRAAQDQAKPSKNNEILLWKIDGFDSLQSPPSEPPVAKPGECTRSSFPHETSSRGFQRLLTFKMPHTDRFYSRASLLHAPGKRPVLAMGSQVSQYHFWDLQKLEEGSDALEITRKKPKGRSRGALKVDELHRAATAHNISTASPSADGETRMTYPYALSLLSDVRNDETADSISKLLRHLPPSLATACVNTTSATLFTN